MLLELEREPVEGAIYRATVYSPTADHPYRATITLPKGEVVVEAIGPPAREEHEEALVTQLRIVARAKIKAPDQPWPRRVLRWRPEKD